MYRIFVASICYQDLSKCMVTCANRGLTTKKIFRMAHEPGLAGGFTTIFDMPNTKPPTTTVARVEEQIQRYTGRCYTDFAINMGTSVEDSGELKRIDKERHYQRQDLRGRPCHHANDDLTHQRYRACFRDPG